MMNWFQVLVAGSTCAHAQWHGLARQSPPARDPDSDPHGSTVIAGGIEQLIELYNPEKPRPSQADNWRMCARVAKVEAAVVATAAAVDVAVAAAAMVGQVVAAAAVGAAAVGARPGTEAEEEELKAVMAAEFAADVAAAEAEAAEAEEAAAAAAAAGEHVSPWRVGGTVVLKRPPAAVQHQRRIGAVLNAWARHPRTNAVTRQALLAFTRLASVEAMVHPRYERSHVSEIDLEWNSFGGQVAATSAVVRCGDIEVRTEWFLGYTHEGEGHYGVDGGGVQVASFSSWWREAGGGGGGVNVNVVYDEDRGGGSGGGGGGRGSGGSAAGGVVAAAVSAPPRRVGGPSRPTEWNTSAPRAPSTARLAPQGPATPACGWGPSDNACHIVRCHLSLKSGVLWWYSGMNIGVEAPFITGLTHVESCFDHYLDDSAAGRGRTAWACRR